MFNLIYSGRKVKVFQSLVQLRGYAFLVEGQEEQNAFILLHNFNIFYQNLEAISLLINFTENI